MTLPIVPAFIRNPQSGMLLMHSIVAGMHARWDAYSIKLTQQTIAIIAAAAGVKAKIAEFEIMSDTTVNSIQSIGDQEYCFRIESRAGACSITLAAKSAEERDSWLIQIETACVENKCSRRGDFGIVDNSITDSFAAKPKYIIMSPNILTYHPHRMDLQKVEGSIPINADTMVTRADDARAIMTLTHYVGSTYSRSISIIFADKMDAYMEWKGLLKDLGVEFGNGVKGRSKTVGSSADLSSSASKPTRAGRTGSLDFEPGASLVGSKTCSKTNSGNVLGGVSQNGSSASAYMDPPVSARGSLTARTLESVGIASGIASLGSKERVKEQSPKTPPQGKSGGRKHKVRGAKYGSWFKDQPALDKPAISMNPMASPRAYQRKPSLATAASSRYGSNNTSFYSHNSSAPNSARGGAEEDGSEGRLSEITGSPIEKMSSPLTSSYSKSMNDSYASTDNLIVSWSHSGSRSGSPSASEPVTRNASKNNGVQNGNGSTSSLESAQDSRVRGYSNNSMDGLNTENANTIRFSQVSQDLHLDDEDKIGVFVAQGDGLSCGQASEGQSNSTSKQSLDSGGNMSRHGSNGVEVFGLSLSGVADPCQTSSGTPTGSAYGSAYESAMGSAAASRRDSGAGAFGLSIGGVADVDRISSAPQSQSQSRRLTADAFGLSISGVADAPTGSLAGSRRESGGDVFGLSISGISSEPGISYVQSIRGVSDAARSRQDSDRGVFGLSLSGIADETAALAETTDQRIPVMMSKLRSESGDSFVSTESSPRKNRPAVPLLSLGSLSSANTARTASSKDSMDTGSADDSAQLLDAFDSNESQLPPKPSSERNISVQSDSAVALASSLSSPFVNGMPPPRGRSISNPELESSQRNRRQSTTIFKQLAKHRRSQGSANGSEPNSAYTSATSSSNSSARSSLTNPMKNRTGSDSAPTTLGMQAYPPSLSISAVNTAMHKLTMPSPTVSMKDESAGVDGNSARDSQTPQAVSAIDNSRTVTRDGSVMGMGSRKSSTSVRSVFETALPEQHADAMTQTGSALQLPDLSNPATLTASNLAGIESADNQHSTDRKAIDIQANVIELKGYGAWQDSEKLEEKDPSSPAPPVPHFLQQYRQPSLESRSDDHDPLERSHSANSHAISVLSKATTESGYSLERIPFNLKDGFEAERELLKVDTMHTLHSATSSITFADSPRALGALGALGRGAEGKDTWRDTAVDSLTPDGSPRSAVSSLVHDPMTPPLSPLSVCTPTSQLPHAYAPHPSQSPKSPASPRTGPTSAVDTFKPTQRKALSPFVPASPIFVDVKHFSDSVGFTLEATSKSHDDEEKWGHNQTHQMVTNVHRMTSGSVLDVPVASTMGSLDHRTGVRVPNVSGDAVVEKNGHVTAMSRSIQTETAALYDILADQYKLQHALAEHKEDIETKMRLLVQKEATALVRIKGEEAQSLRTCEETCDEMLRKCHEKCDQMLAEAQEKAYREKERIRVAEYESIQRLKEKEAEAAVNQRDADEKIRQAEEDLRQATEEMQRKEALANGEITKALERMKHQEKELALNMQKREDASMLAIQRREENSLRRVKDAKEHIMKEVLHKYRHIDELKQQIKYATKELIDAQCKAEKLHRQRAGEMQLVARGLARHHTLIVEERKRIARQRMNLDYALRDLNNMQIIPPSDKVEGYRTETD